MLLCLVRLSDFASFVDMWDIEVSVLIQDCLYGF
jgi:hypothetical protein